LLYKFVLIEQQLLFKTNQYNRFSLKNQLKITTSSGKRNQHGAPKLRDFEGIWRNGYKGAEGVDGNLGRSGGGSKTAAASGMNKESLGISSFCCIFKEKATEGEWDIGDTPI